MRSDKLNLVSLAVVAGLFIVILLTGVVGSVRNGNYVVLAIVFTALALCGGAIWFAHYRVRVLLQDRTPDRIIRHYHRSVRRIPHANAAAAYLSALAAAFFGQFDRARAELDAVDWDSTTPVYRGHRLYVLATLALLEETNYPKALQYARQARELENREPGGGLQVLDDVIHLVAQAPSEGTVERLDRVAKKQHGLMPGMAAWALAVYYRRANEMAKAAEFKTLLRLAVPHSLPLKRAERELPPGERA